MADVGFCYRELSDIEMQPVNNLWDLFTDNRVFKFPEIADFNIGIKLNKEKNRVELFDPNEYTFATLGVDTKVLEVTYSKSRTNKDYIKNFFNLFVSLVNQSLGRAIQEAYF